MAQIPVEIEEYSVLFTQSNSIIQVYDADRNNVARLIFRVTGTPGPTRLVPASGGTWPLTAFVQAELPLPLFAGIADMLRNEKPVRFFVDFATTPFSVSVGTSQEPIGEEETSG